ncbi:N-acetylmuramidase domain-containing protein [Flavobacterium procerum]|uniref:N-acetylmuramidase domain-containing protein n=1 Tax=Flavobacterium procerum TaxID=1455569 RepID=A0ABV6BVK4_9FLAO
MYENFFFIGTGEYLRLEKARNLSQDKKVVDVVNSSASWGLFQIMGFNAVFL